ncbi:MAG TPA: GAF domain-containing protein [Polyangia bacterium]
MTKAVASKPANQGSSGHSATPDDLARELQRLTEAEASAHKALDHATAVAERLQAVSTALSAATSLEQAAQVGVEQIATWLGARGGALALIDDEAGVMRIASSYGVAPERLRDFREIPLSAPVPVVDAVKGCRPVVISGAEALAAGYPHLVAVVDPRFKAWVSIPFVHEDRAVGAAWFLFEEPREFSASDTHVMMSIGRQAALAILRARAFEAERQARARVEHVLELTRRFEDITRRVSRAMSVDGMADAAIQGAAEAFRSASTAIYLLDDAGDNVRLLAGEGLPSGSNQRYALIPIAQDSPISQCLREARSIFLEGRAAYRQRYPESEQRIRGLLPEGELSMACVPLIVEGRAQGALVLTFSSLRTFDEDERRFMVLLGDHCALALARADLFERERDARMVAENALDRARTADQRKDEFLAMLGHELRNPLAPISTALQLVRLRGSDPYPREHAIIDRQVKHLERLVDDLLDVSRITRGKVELKREPVELAALVAEAIDVVSPSLEQKSHRLDVTVPQGVTLFGDHIRLCQVLSNLLTNAAKYTDPGGQISIRAVVENDQVTISVRDNGIGIDGRLLPHIFDVFTQAPQTIERSQGGLGLGLTIVKQIAELHGGSVEAHSDGLGLGSEFSVHLPLAPADEVEPNATTRQVVEPDPAVETGGRRIVVVDDNEDAANVIADALSMLGHEVRVAHDGPSALEVVKEFHPEVVCLDIGLPVMDGYEVARRLRIEYATSLRIVAITGYGQDQDRAKSLAAGIDVHLVKPVDLDTLMAACLESA